MEIEKWDKRTCRRVSKRLLCPLLQDYGGDLDSQLTYLMDRPYISDFLQSSLASSEYQATVSLRYCTEGTG